MRASLAEFGADPSALRLLDDERPELLPYATLTTARRNGHATLGAVEAVYEWQDAPLVFLINADALEDECQLERIRRLLAMRGDAPYLGVVAPGSLCVYRIALDKVPLQAAQVARESRDGARITVFPRLGNERPQAAITDRGWISNVVLRLLDGSTTSVIKLGVSQEDAISLVGRALFTRFLADRSLLPQAMSGPGTAASLFDTREVAQDTSDWLDATFNGDPLPLSAGVFEVLPAQGYSVLGDVLRRAPDGQLFLGWEEKWGNLDFAHIPIGVLSQAYELYLRKHAPAKQKREGGYFTPGPIAELMVRASMRALQRRNIGKLAKVLDPAVGGGIFLLTAFRELVAEHWRADGKRPDTEVLRRILYKQMAGFDINEAALRFTALGLYLLSIELDPHPRPVDKLRFEDLRGTVLHRVLRGDEEEGEALGSLGPLVGDEHKGRYDLVIGNPPWPGGTGLQEWKSVRKTVGRIAADRGIANTAPPLPNEVLDLPFVWRAMEWARPDGQIAFALHARLLFQQGGGMPTVRQALFEALDVTSIVNGAELRKTKVWPQISAPFCILFATNRKPGVEAGFRFISPRIEDSLNSAGGMRIDALNAEVVPSRQLADIPEILKILFRASRADLGILERIRAQGHPTLADFWRGRIGVSDRGRLRGSGNGYQSLRPSSRIRKRGDGLPGAAATYLHGLPEITAASFRENIFVDTESLEVFSHDRIHDPRSPDLFAGPLIVVHKSPPAATGRLRVAISEEDVVFNETFYGYSPSTHGEAGLLVRYMALVLGSRLVIWFALITSGEFGFERDVVEKASLDRMPLPDFDKLTPQHRGEIERLVAGLQSGEASWEEVDEWVVRLYGLSQRDLQVVLDTLEFNLPFARNKRNAQDVPSLDERERFCEVLRDELRPWCDRFGSRVAVDQVPPLAMSPWHAVAVRTARREPLETVGADDCAGLVRVADESAASEILVSNGPDELLIGRLAQRRYWSETQARLLAQRIAWSHIELLKRHAAA
ncbi:MAG: N-6 DNA methylase [Bryobacterales bacterium]|nr:N-6 DNA methylase [Bryobacterales bacterium]